MSSNYPFWERVMDVVDMFEGLRRAVNSHETIVSLIIAQVLLRYTYTL